MTSAGKKIAAHISLTSLFLFFSLLLSRFIINVPEEERTDLIRIFFQIEIAHWFYLDFYCDSSFTTISASSCNQLTKSPNFGAMTNCISPYNGQTDGNYSSSNDESTENNVIQKQKSQLLKPCSIRTFAENIFRHCPFLMQHTNQVDDILSKWKVFKVLNKPLTVFSGVLSFTNVLNVKIACCANKWSNNS